ncbi:MAG TPA: hypothetical protein VFG01_12015 [Acidobacteriota bacterium]|nr:hypothetical protein [Acidobacteriota bacterium]
MKNKNRWLVILLVGSMVFLSILTSSQEQEDRIKLIRILNKAEEYCNKLGNAAFDFVCKEKITEKIDVTPEWTPSDRILKIVKDLPGSWGPSKKIKKNTFVYDYQLIKKGRDVVEKRILLKENGKKRHEINAQLKTQMFHFAKPLFGPTGLLSSYWQDRLDYRILHKEELKGEETFLIEAVPKPSLNQKHLYGKIWIKESDFSIVKIEWIPESMKNYEEIEKTAKKYKAKPRITCVTEFNIEKQGIRFPSKVFIQEAYLSKKGRYIKSETTIEYTDYKFFTVETEIKY